MNLLTILLLLFRPVPVSETVSIQKTYDVAEADELLVMVNNIFGDVTIEPSKSGKVELDLKIRISANSAKLVEQGKRELKLGEYLAKDSMVFYTKAPFIRDCDEPPFKGGWWNEEIDYSFTYDYTIRIPSNANISAKTVNEGDVVIKGISGTVSAWNVNGGLEIREVGDLRKASTVNGDVTIDFSKSPVEPIDFHTVNGNFKLKFPDDLAAKIYFDTMHGDIYSAFEYRRAAPIVQESRKGTKYRISSKSGVEIGSGGPVLNFRSINGNVYIDKLN